MAMSALAADPTQLLVFMLVSFLLGVSLVIGSLTGCLIYRHVIPRKSEGTCQIATADDKEDADEEEADDEDEADDDKEECVVDVRPSGWSDDEAPLAKEKAVRKSNVRNASTSKPTHRNNVVAEDNKCFGCKSNPSEETAQLNEIAGLDLD